MLILCRYRYDFNYLFSNISEQLFTFALHNAPVYFLFLILSASIKSLSFLCKSLLVTGLRPGAASSVLLQNQKHFCFSASSYYFLSVWPDLAKYYERLANLWRFIQFLGKILINFDNFFANGQFFICCKINNLVTLILLSYESLQIFKEE